MQEVLAGTCRFPTQWTLRRRKRTRRWSPTVDSNKHARRAAPGGSLAGCRLAALATFSTCPKGGRTVPIASPGAGSVRRLHRLPRLPPVRDQFFSTGIFFPGASNPFVGWSNYTKIFHDPIVRTAARNSFLWVVVTVPTDCLGLFAAAVLTDRLPGSIFWRAARLHSRRHLVRRRELGVLLSFRFAGRRGQRSPRFFTATARASMDGADLDR